MQKSYESKQYKKGLKAADTILKKFPDHGGIVCFSCLKSCAFESQISLAYPLMNESYEF